MPNSIPNQHSIIQTELSAVTKRLGILSITLYIVSATYTKMEGEPIKLGRHLHASFFSQIVTLPMPAILQKQVSITTYSCDKFL